MTIEKEVKEPYFKVCGMCDTAWRSVQDFLEDPELVIIGYQALFDDLGSGLFLFNHECRTTLACNVKEFQELCGSPVHGNAKTDTDDCPGYCRISDNLEPCSVECRCAHVRATLHRIKNWPKNPAPRKALA